MLIKPRIAVFIDGANAYATGRTLGVHIDYKKLLDKVKSTGYLVRAYYYSAVRTSVDEGEYSSIRPLLDWLDYNGFAVVTKEAKEWMQDDGVRKIKGNMDIEIAVDMMELADHVDHIYLFSGDGDFTSLLYAVQRKGVRVFVISTIKTRPPMIADELRRQCDEFIDLADMKDQIRGTPFSERT